MLTSTCLGQAQYVDSLLQVASATKSDSIRFTSILDVGKYYRKKNPDSARHYLQKALEEAQNSTYGRGVIVAYTNIGISYGMEGNYPQAILHFEKSLTEARKQKISRQEIAGYQNLGIIYRRISDYPTSYNYYIKGLALSDSINDIESRASFKFSIAVLHDQMKEPDKALELLRESLVLFKQIGQEPDNVYNSFGVIFTKKEMYDSALFYYNKSLEGERKAGNVEDEAVVISNIGNIYWRTNRFSEAKEVLKEALTKADSLNLSYIKSSILYNLSKTYLATNQLKKALQYGEENLLVARSLNNYNLIGQAYENLSEIHQELNDYSASLENYKLHKLYRDSLFNENKTAEFKAQQIKFEVYEKDQELAKQELRLAHLDEKTRLDQRWKYGLVAAAILLLLTLILLFQKYQLRVRHNSILKSTNKLIVSQNQSIEEMNNILETRILRAQMNPHFVFNSLNSIQHFVTINDKNSALRYLSKFSTLLRNILENSASMQVTLEEEITLIKVYLELESLRFDSKFKYEINVDPSLETTQIDIPLMLVQPYIENAIIHGLMPSDKPEKLLSISFAKVGENNLRIVVEDNGMGREASIKANMNKPEKRKSLGMSVTEKRLKLLERNNGLITKLAINDLYSGNMRSSGTQVVIDISQPIAVKDEVDYALT